MMTSTLLGKIAIKFNFETLISRKTDDNMDIPLKMPRQEIDFILPFRYILNN
jgi:hypothetical protein